MKFNIKSDRRTEIKRMIDNEFSERKSFLIKELELSKDADNYLKCLKSLEEKYIKIKCEVDSFFWEE